MSLSYSNALPLSSALLLLCICGLPLIVDAQAGGFEGFGGENKFCPPFQCPKDHEPVPKWPLKLASAGCSGMGGMQVFSQTSAEDDPQAPCCDQRHACLQTCGSLKTFCDEEFLKCTKSVCDDMTDGEKKKACDQASNVNDLMVKMDTCQRFDQEQNSHCECVKTKDVEEKRERLLQNFYKKYAPESIDKVSGLAKKATKSPSTMVGLLLKLYKKYPQVIQKVKDPQQEYMEKMMKGAKDISKEEFMEKKKKQMEDNAEDLGTEEL